jgi:ABC-2 type transport system ATP-binding protein
MSASNGFALEAVGLTKRFGKKTAVDDLTLKVPTGSVFAFLGKNGAGKTSTIRILLDMLDRTSGDAKILGMDCVKDAIEIKKRVGYVAEGQKMYDWMRVDEMIWFCKGFYPDWDDAFAEAVKQRLELPGSQKIGEMSRGTQAKLALLLAMAFKPDLLILDEPTAGLDPVASGMLKAALRQARTAGRTILISSHILVELEEFADDVAFLSDGHLRFAGPVEALLKETGTRRLEPAVAALLRGLKVV